MYALCEINTFKMDTTQKFLMGGTVWQEEAPRLFRRGQGVSRVRHLWESGPAAGPEHGSFATWQLWRAKPFLAARLTPKTEPSCSLCALKASC